MGEGLSSTTAWAHEHPRSCRSCSLGRVGMGGGLRLHSLWREAGSWRREIKWEGRGEQQPEGTLGEGIPSRGAVGPLDDPATCV